MSFERDELNIFQITDTHLFDDDTKQMYGVSTNINFYKVIDEIKKNESLKPDFFILTGDLSQDESEESYIKIVKKIEETNINTYWIPGNHDNIEKMESIFSKSKLFSRIKKLSLKYWDFIFLNTKIDNSHGGYLSEQELFSLENELNSIEKKRNIAIVMHHHPIKVNTPLIDKYIIENARDFLDIISQNKNIKLIICGHVHGDYSIKHNAVSIECAPATCLQWKTGTTLLEIKKSMGFKVYHFHGDNYSCFSKTWEFD